MSNVYLLKDISRLSGHSVHTVKFYLKRGLIQEAGRFPETRFRFFDDATLQRLAAIRRLRKQHKSLAEIARELSKAGSSRLENVSSRALPCSPQPPAAVGP